MQCYEISYSGHECYEPIFIVDPDGKLSRDSFNKIASESVNEGAEKLLGSDRSFISGDDLLEQIIGLMSKKLPEGVFIVAPKSHKSCKSCKSHITKENIIYPNDVIHLWGECFYQKSDYEGGDDEKPDLMEDSIWDKICEHNDKIRNRH